MTSSSPDANHLDLTAEPVEVDFRECVVLFFDLLGTQTWVQEKDEQARVDRLRHIVPLWNGIVRSIQFDEKTAKVCWFSDNIAFLVWTDLVGVLTAIKMVVALSRRLQAALALAGEFARGGIAVGSMSVQDPAMFGPALVRAVSTEKGAQFPRVMLDDSVVEVLRRSRDDRLHRGGDLVYGQIGLEYGRSVVFDRFNCFVNYLPISDVDPAISDLSIDGVQGWLMRHRNVIRDEMDDLRKNGRAKEHGYLRWLGQHHNWHCDQLRHLAESSREETPPGVDSIALLDAYLTVEEIGPGFAFGVG